jgi:hypothetical protein
VESIVIAHRTGNRDAAVDSPLISLTDTHLPLRTVVALGRGA